MTSEHSDKRIISQDWDHWKRTIDSSDEPVAVVDANSIIHYCNQPFKKLVPGIEVGHNVLQALDPLNKETWEDFTRAYAAKKAQTMEFATRNGPGNRWLHARVVPISNNVPLYFFVNVQDITEHKNREDELRRRDELLQKAEKLGGLASWNWIVKEDRGYWSDNLYRMVGLEPQSLTLNQNSFTQIIHPDDRERIGKVHLGVLTADPNVIVQDFQAEFRLLRSDGTPVAVHARFEVEYDSGGNAVKMSGVLLDITERQRIQEELRISKERWQFALENAGDGLWDWNPKTDEAFFSRRWEAMLGYEDHEIKPLGSEWASRVHPDDLPKCYLELERHFKGKAPLYHCEHRIRCKDGSYKWILARGRVVARDADGQPVRIVGTHTDMTERRLAEQSLKESEALLDAAGRMARVGGWELDTRTKALTWTAETYRIHEVPFDQKPTLKDAINFYHPEDRPILEQALENAINHGTAFDLELRFSTATGRSLFTRAICKPIHEDGRVVRLIGTFQDITEIKQMELALIAANEKLKLEQQQLEERNIALRIVLKQHQDESDTTKQQIAQNIERIVKPTLLKLRAAFGERGRIQLDALESALDEVTSPFITEIGKQFVNLTPREMEICNHIKNGLRSKEIADILNISPQTVGKFRQKIRKKLKIGGTSANLSSFLRSQRH